MKQMILLIFIFSPSLWAASTPSFDNLSDADFKTISEEFSGIFVHTSATPPTSLGKLFGVEAAMIAGAAEIPGIEQISKRIDPTIKAPYAPFAFLYGAVSVPFGITIETNLLPQIDINDFEMSHYGAGVKWSLVDSILPNLPFDLAVKTFYSKSKLGFTQTIPSPTTVVDVGFENNMFGVETVLGISLPMIQPYAGVGYVTSHSELRGVAQADPSFSMYLDGVSQSKKTTVESMRYIVGCQFNLTALKITLEYNRIFDNNRIAAKLGLAF
ncbi:hypothetical protein K2X05_10645 [bacterium]|nr:hypothetical protein [bacterium]